MLVNVKFFKKIFLVWFFLSTSPILYAGEKEEITKVTSEDKQLLEEDNNDEMYNKALEVIKSDGKASTSYLQRKLQIGYNRAARIIDLMEERGVVSKANHVGKREVL